MMNFFNKKMMTKFNTNLNPEQQDRLEPTGLSSDLDENVQALNSIYDHCPDVIFNHLWIGGKIKALLIYVKGLTNEEQMDKLLLSPLLQNTFSDTDPIKTILQQWIPVSDKKEISFFEEVIEQISKGNPVILIDQEDQGLALGMSKWEKRGIDEPSAEPVVRGPREGFTETLTVNLSLLRRKIRTPALKIRYMTIGRHTQTQVAITYIEGIIDPSIIEEVTSRLQRIDIDGVLESGYIEAMIEDNPLSPFPQLLTTERPDVVTSGLLEGRAAILVDGTPFAMIVPICLFSFFQSAEDYYQKFIFGTCIRWLRYFFFLVALLAPSAYVSILTFHQEMVPTHLLLSISKSRVDIPFPALVEALIMEITFEALREAGVRLPKQVGAAVGIVGALVIGQAATAAGLVSAPMVMVVAITGISSFMIPRYSSGLGLRLLRFPMMIVSGTFGLFGLLLGTIIIVIHLCTLHSFGVPYLSPVAPFKRREIHDVISSPPLWSVKTRPYLTGGGNKTRQSSAQKPGTGPSQGSGNHD